MYPFRLPEAKALQNNGLESEDIKNTNEIGIFIDSVGTLGTGTRFSDLYQILGRSSEMKNRYQKLVERHLALSENILKKRFNEYG